MKPQYDNKLLSSFLLYLDNKILSKGEAFTNHSGLFYPVENFFNGYYTYAAPFKQLVYDKSVSGANQVSGVYVGGVFKTPGTGGSLVSINPNQGQVYFDTNPDPSEVSGNYAIKDFSLLITDEREEKLLFETQYSLKPKANQTITGLDPETTTYPVIFLKVNSAANESFALGALDNSVTNIRAIVIADSAFLLDAACSIIKDCKNDRFTVLETSSLPVDAFGGYTGVFNYTGVDTAKVPVVWNVDVSKILPSRGQFTNLNPNVLCAFADFEIHDIRTHK